MSEQIVFPDDWRKRLKDAVLVAVDVDWRRVHGELERELESWPRVQVPASEDEPRLFRCSREKHVYGQVPCEHCEPADSHEPAASSDPSDEWCGRCDRHLNVCEADQPASQSHPGRVDAIDLLWPDLAADAVEVMVAKQPSEPNDWTPEAGERVHVIPVGLEGDVAGFDVDGAVFVRYDDYSVFPYRVGSLRPASKDSERAGQ